MRTIGFVLLLIGGLIIYLAWKGKIGAAVNVVLTGQSLTPSKSSSGGKDLNPSDNVPGTLPGSGVLIQGGYS